MTITTAERASAGARNALRLAPLALAAMFVSAECRADWKFVPQMDLRETYSDNVGLSPDDLAHGAWISESIPRFSLTGSGPRFEFSANGQWHAYAYSNTEANNLQNNNRQYNAQGRAKLIEDLLFIDGNASSSRQSISAFGPLQNDLYSNNNNTDISTWRISPYLQHRFDGTADLTMRYSRDSVKGGTIGYGDSLASTRSLDLVSGSNFTELGWSLSYNHQDLEQELAGSSSMETSQAGLHWAVMRRFALTATVGYDNYEYPVLKERTAGRSWSGGFDWEPSTRTHVKLSYGRRYFGKTGSLDAMHRTQHTMWTLTYSDQVTTSRSQFLLPATVNTAGMLDQLFTASYPDPAQRQQAVQAYIAALGLPPSLTDNVNFLSNRYQRDRRLQGAATLRGARSALVFTVFTDRNNALSMQQSDSSLLGSQLAGLNDDVKQRGASATFDYRLSERTSANANLYQVHAQSVVTGIVTNSRDLRIGMTRRFDRKIHGNVELRHLYGQYGGTGNAPYHENAIAATLSVLY